MKSVAFHNLGCKVNSYEMDVMQQYFQKNGYDIVDFAQKADIYIINTCTVTNIADRKSRQMIHRAKSLNPDAVVVAVGCYVQTHESQVLKDVSIDLAIGNNRKKDIIRIIEDYLDGGPDLVTEDISRGAEYEELELYQTAEHTRAYIKIQDGCDQFCSYCAIPLARGRVRSRAHDAVIREAKRMSDRGYREIVLTGIHLSSYGMDFDGASYNVMHERGREEGGIWGAHLLDLIDRLSVTEGIDRIRLSSLEPRIITGEFAKRLASNKKVCPHFHLSLQSGCDSVLARMNRKYTTDDFGKSVDILRGCYGDPAITTDIIAGFPGESEGEFEASLEFVDSIGFYETHIFPYSRRKGTAADRMDGQLTEKEKKTRCAAYQKINEKNRAEYIGRFIGKRMQVLIEREKNIEGMLYDVGHTVNYIEVAIPKKDDGIDMAGRVADCFLERLSDTEGIVFGGW